MSPEEVLPPPAGPESTSMKTAVPGGIAAGWMTNEIVPLISAGAGPNEKILLNALGDRSGAGGL